MTDPVTSLLEWAIAALLVIGAGFALVGSLGLAKLGDFYRRLHGPTKATTLGVGAVLVASSLFFTALNGTPSLHELLVTAFLFVTAPVSAQLLVRSSLAERPEPPAPVVAPPAGAAAEPPPAAEPLPPPTTALPTAPPPKDQGISN